MHSPTAAIRTGGRPTTPSPIGAIGALERIAKAHPDERVLVITHGGLIRSIYRRLGLDTPHLANLSGLWVRVDGEGITAGELIEIVDHAAVAASVPDSE